MDLNADNFFMESYPFVGSTLDIHEPKPQNAITSLPDDFSIKTMSDIQKLKEYIAFKYTKGIKLYRGHESSSYKIESTIVRYVKMNNRNCSFQNISDAEKRGFDMFCNNVFQEEWLYNKPEKTNETLFKMSIGRHLGLPCRLIDVTASLETAIWFAIMNPQHYNVDGEIIFIVLNNEAVAKTANSLFKANKLSYSHEPFFTNRLDDLLLGEQRRFFQNGHFIWVDDNSLLNEEQVISNLALHIERFTIPWHAKLTLVVELCREVYCGYAYNSDIEKIKKSIL